MATSLNRILANVYQNVSLDFPAASVPDVPEVYVPSVVAFLQAACKTIAWDYDHFTGTLNLHWTQGTLRLP